MHVEHKFTVINIREYLAKSESLQEQKLREEQLQRILSEFSCEINPDVEGFLKEQSIEFANKHQSVSYLVFPSDDTRLLGYFTITIKPITVNADVFSNTTKKKLSRVSSFNDRDHTYSLAAFLIAQLGKNYALEPEERISGEDLLGLSISVVKQIQYQAGGTVVFLEANDDDKLLNFYRNNRFQPFDKRIVEQKNRHQHELIQLLRLL